MSAPAANDTRGWLRTLAPRPAAKSRLYLLPHAGGGPAFFRDWIKLFGPDVELVAIQAPGREARISEPLMTSMPPLADAIARGIAARSDLPYAIFGHSLGALVALETTLQLRKLNASLPTSLIVSGSRSPRYITARQALWTLTDAEIRDEMIRMGGTPQIVLENDEYFQLMLPTLRADLQIYDTYAPSESRPFDLPVLALGGQTDERTAIKELVAWNDITTGPFECRVLSGGHFYLGDHRTAVTTAINDWIVKPQSSFKSDTSIVDLWLLPLDQPATSQMTESLSEVEQIRAGKFLRPRDHNRFAAGRGMTRVILGRYLDTAAADVKFRIGPFGKPAIDSSIASGLHFNVSHSDGIGVLAIGRQELGADIERFRDDIDVDGISARFYSPGELKHLAATAVPQRRNAFFSIWAGKEAYCKARGLGLQLPTDSYAVVPNAVVPWNVDDPGVAEAERPRVYPLFIAPGFAGALASVAPVNQIRICEWKDVTT